MVWEWNEEEAFWIICLWAWCWIISPRKISWIISILIGTANNLQDIRAFFRLIDWYCTLMLIWKSSNVLRISLVLSVNWNWNSNLLFRHVNNLSTFLFNGTIFLVARNVILCVAWKSFPQHLVKLNFTQC